MMSQLTRKHEEALRLLNIYAQYKDSPDSTLCRKVHVELDRFLMENRETAIICMEQVLADEIQRSVEAARSASQVNWVKPESWLKKLLRRRGGDVHGQA